MGSGRKSMSTDSLSRSMATPSFGETISCTLAHRREKRERQRSRVALRLRNKLYTGRKTHAQCPSAPVLAGRGVRFPPDAGSYPHLSLKPFCRRNRNSGLFRGKEGKIIALHANQINAWFGIAHCTSAGIAHRTSGISIRKHHHQQLSVHIG